MQAFNHAGNAIGSAIAGLAGYLVSLRAGFWIASMAGIFVLVTTLLIKPRLIDHDLARGLRPRNDGTGQPSGLTVLLRNRPLLTRHRQHRPGCALPSRVDHRRAGGDDPHGDPGRAANTTSIIAIQALDGVGAGLQGVLFPIMVADLTRGSGRYNVAMGAATMIQGIGAALSTTLAGAIIVVGGYDTAMVALTSIAVLALILRMVAVPETAQRPSKPPAPTLALPPAPPLDPTAVG
jgi:hypothetical protein